ncbi:MAG TPA: right-handed parallel beta-helix repeat-containing protein [Dokdonella sp.]
MKTDTSIHRRRMRQNLLTSCLALALAGGTGIAGATPGAAGWTSAPPAPRSFATGPRINARAEEWKRLHPPPPAHPDGGVIHVVTNCNNAGAGSLRDAVTAAADGDTIDLASLACSSITLTTGTLATGADNLALVGPGRDLLTISGDNAGPVFVHVGSGQLSLTGLTVVSGAKYSNTTESAPGGCIYSQGSVFMDDAGAKYCTAQANGTGDALGGAVYARAGAVLFESTISGSTAHSVDGGASGGGLYSPGPVLAKYSIFRNNTASTDGGGGFGGAAFLGGDVTITRSTIQGNTAGSIGGLALTGSSATGNLVINNSTITDNYGSNSLFGGGVYFGSNATVSNSTITGNVEANTVDSKYGGGLSAKYPTTIDLNSSIVSGNSLFDGSTHFPSDIGAAGAANPPTITGSHNLVGYAESGLPGDTLMTSDPRLGPLSSEGGPTPTMPPLTGSLAFNAGAGGGDYDQRGPGYPRLVGTGVDIGAFESDALLIDGFD